MGEVCSICKTPLEYSQRKLWSIGMNCVGYNKDGTVYANEKLLCKRCHTRITEYIASIQTNTLYKNVIDHRGIKYTIAVTDDGFVIHNQNIIGSSSNTSEVTPTMKSYLEDAMDLLSHGGQNFLQEIDKT